MSVIFGITEENELYLREIKELQMLLMGVSQMTRKKLFKLINNYVLHLLAIWQ